MNAISCGDNTLTSNLACCGDTAEGFDTACCGDTAERTVIFLSLRFNDETADIADNLPYTNIRITPLWLIVIYEIIYKKNY